MHRIEGENVDVSSGVNLFSDNPPYTVATPAWCNAVQEEIMNVIVNAGLPVLDENADQLYRNQLWTAINGLVAVPVGSVIAWIPGYYGAAGNGGGFTSVSIDLASNWVVCDGSAVNDANSPIFDGAGRHVPDLTDDRFLMGDLVGNLGDVGGSNTQTHSVPAHYHGMGTGADLNIASSGSHRHTDIEVQAAAAWWNAQLLTSGYGLGSEDYGSGSEAATTSTRTGLASHTHASGDFAGRIGLVTGGVDGNSSMTSGSSDNRPTYLSCRYIMRIK